MSLLANKITANSIGPANVGTATTGDNSTQIASYNFVNNSLNALNYVGLNVTTVIGGIKTFINGLPLTGGTNALTPVTVGAVRASVLDLLPATTGTQQIYIGVQLQSLNSILGTGNLTFKNPVLVKDTNNRIQTGGIPTTTPAGTTLTFPVPFNSTPLVLLTTSVIGTDLNTGVFDVTPTGFKAVSNATGRVFWIALGS